MSQNFYASNALNFLDIQYIACLFINTLEGNQNKNNRVVSNFDNKLKSPGLCSHVPVSRGEKDGKFLFVVEIAHKAVVLIFICL